ncbi:MAG TPA: redoxin domain-containing protein [Thermoanaerobaculia bacterium]|nr:redoxin domain-containing protein [Thermoanaerobaculia bacterium]
MSEITRTLRYAPLLLATVLVLPACGRAAETATPSVVGGAAPDFTLVDVSGETHPLADLAGKVVVLEWVNPNCPFSERHAREGTMTGLAEQHAEVVWLGINSTAEGHRDYLQPAAYQEYLDEKGISYPILYDRSGEVGRAYAAKTTPHMIVIDPAGKIVYDGAIDDDPPGRKPAAERTNYVAAALAAQAAGQAVDPARTKPYGCSVKYE